MPIKWVDTGIKLGPNQANKNNKVNFFKLFVFDMSHARLEWFYTLYYCVCQGTPCSKQARYLKIKELKQDSNPQPLSLYRNTQPPNHINYLITETVCLNDWIFVYEMSGCRFDFRFCHKPFLFIDRVISYGKF